MYGVTAVRLSTSHIAQTFYFVFFLAAFFVFAGLLLPNEPLNVFPFFVFLSPLPIIIDLNMIVICVCNVKPFFCINKKAF
jgi:hypothetical protein